MLEDYSCPLQVAKQNLMFPSVPNSPELDALNARVAECDKHHHFYHYKSSWMHLAYANALRAAGNGEAAKKHYKAAIFQDHLNEEAKTALAFPSPLTGEGGAKHRMGVNESDITITPTRLSGDLPRQGGGEKTYDTHITTGAIEALITFEASLGWEKDVSVELCRNGQYEEALKICAARHDAYHHHASASHVARGKWFEDNSYPDLAIADYSKALDLNGKNTGAITSRARVYRAKNNLRLAEEDETRLKALA